jgi:hypothetical protein
MTDLDAFLWGARAAADLIPWAELRGHVRVLGDAGVLLLPHPVPESHADEWEAEGAVQPIPIPDEVVLSLPRATRADSPAPAARQEPADAAAPTGPRLDDRPRRGKWRILGR